MLKRCQRASSVVCRYVEVTSTVPTGPGTGSHPNASRTRRRVLPPPQPSPLLLPWRLPVAPRGQRRASACSAMIGVCASSRAIKESRSPTALASVMDFRALLTACLASSGDSAPAEIRWASSPTSTSSASNRFNVEGEGFFWGGVGDLTNGTLAVCRAHVNRAVGIDATEARRTCSLTHGHYLARISPKCVHRTLPIG